MYKKRATNISIHSDTSADFSFFSAGCFPLWYSSKSHQEEGNGMKDALNCLVTDNSQHVVCGRREVDPFVDIPDEASAAFPFTQHQHTARLLVKSAMQRRSPHRKWSATCFLLKISWGRNYMPGIMKSRNGNFFDSSDYPPLYRTAFSKPQGVLTCCPSDQLLML